MFSTATGSAEGAGDRPRAAEALIEIWHAERRRNVHIRSVQDDHDLRDSASVANIGERNRADSARKSRSVKDGLSGRKERGKLVGAIPLGYTWEPEIDERGQLVYNKRQLVTRRIIDEDDAAIVGLIFEWIEQGASPGDIARRLNRDGVRTKRGKTWEARAVRRIVLSDVYTGATGYPALIDRDRWERAQASLTRLDPVAVQRRKGGHPAGEFYLLRGVAFCTQCEAPMYTRRYAAGRHYVCRNVLAATGLCDAERVPAEALEVGTLGHLDELIPHVEAWIATKAAERRGERGALEAVVATERQALRALERDVAKFDEAYASQVRAGEMRLADLALRHVGEAADRVEEQCRIVQDAEARLGEWDVSPSAVDGALDFYRQVVDVIQGRIKRAAGADEIRAALNDLLFGVWVGADTLGRLSAEIVLRQDAVAVGGIESVAFLRDPAEPVSAPAWLQPAVARDAAISRTEPKTLV